MHLATVFREFSEASNAVSHFSLALMTSSREEKIIANPSRPEGDVFICEQVQTRIMIPIFHSQPSLHVLLIFPLFLPFIQREPFTYFSHHFRRNSIGLPFHRCAFRVWLNFSYFYSLIAKRQSNMSILMR